VNVLDLFSGIGGFSLGLERAGLHTIAFCEIEPYCRAVLAKRWPGIPIHADVRELNLPTGFADVICGGFPCQDISVGNQHNGGAKGLAGARSGLWSEYRRLIEDVCPSWVVIENVVALRSRGLDQVLRELVAIGYDAEWYCIPASAVGALHRRDRIWIVAYPQREQLRQQPRRWNGAGGPSAALTAVDGKAWPLANADPPRLEGWLRAELRECACQLSAGASGSSGIAGTWIAESDIRRVADGVPSRVDRLKSLGNAVIPQIPEIIGRAILEWERRQ
jgi:DNA (cytosine-5)-methyltransferase 1